MKPRSRARLCQSGTGVKAIMVYRRGKKIFRFRKMRYMKFCPGTQVMIERFGLLNP
jgi:hypothetical protein